MHFDDRRRIAQRASDVLTAIAAIRSYLKGIDREAYLRERRAQSAVERELLTVSEACRKILQLDDTVEERFPEVPWRDICGIGNIIRHDYRNVDLGMIWDTVTSSDLDTLASALDRLRSNL